MLTGNRGEWSEIYAFFKVLLDREIHTKDNKKYPILSIRRMDADGGTTYRILQNDQFEVKSPHSFESKIISLPDLRSSVSKIFSEIEIAS
jgi:type II restriction enzyme